MGPQEQARFTKVNCIAEVSWLQGCLPWAPLSTLWQMATISLARFRQLVPALLPAAFLHCPQASPQTWAEGRE